MPKGIPGSGKGKPGPLSQQTLHLIEVMRDIEERVAASKRKDRARAQLVSFAHKHGLTASDLRDAAKLVAARETGSEPVVSQNLGKAKRAALGRAIKKAREAKGMTGAQLRTAVGAKGSGTVSLWERGGIPANPSYRAGLIKHLDLPKDFFAEASKANGAHP